MAEPNDPGSDDVFDALVRANPVDARAVPSPTESAAAAALFEEITMTDVQDLAAEPTRRSRWPLAIAGAAAAAIALLAAFAVSGGGEDPKQIAESPGTTSAPEPVEPGGGMALCVFLYDLDTLAERERAFDGTVTGVEGDTITFTVNEWFRGGSGDTTAAEGAGTLSGMTSVSEGLDLSAGSRLLVAGDDEFAWGCGFTQVYDASVADDWRATLAG